jgi:hypothetical protein
MDTRLKNYAERLAPDFRRRQGRSHGQCPQDCRACGRSISTGIIHRVSICAKKCPQAAGRRPSFSPLRPIPLGPPLRAWRCYRHWIYKVSRRFLSPDLDYQPPPDNFIWSCYSREREVESVTAVLECVVSEYNALVRGWAFQLESSPYLNPAIAVVFSYVPSHDSRDGTEPTVYEYHVRNSDGSLPKTTVLSTGLNSEFGSPVAASTVVIENVSRVVEVGISRAAAFFFRRQKNLWVRVGSGSLASE